MKNTRKVLAIVTVDIMAWKLLRPWFHALRDSGYEVHIACARTDWFDQLAADGFQMHEVRMRRRVNPFLHVLPFWHLYRLIRRGGFQVVNTHSPVAAVIGRLAASLARTPMIIYTVHGFYFHDDMAWLPRRALITLEWLVGRVTNRFMFVSDEDRVTAAREGISSRAQNSETIFNGVDLNAFPSRASPALRTENQALRKTLAIPLTRLWLASSAAL